MRLDHIYVETRRYEDALAFWQGLGFEVAATWGEDGHRAGRLVAGEAAVVLAEAPPGTPPTGPVVHLGVADVDAAAATAQASGAVEVVTGPEDTHWGTRWARLRDPDGHVHVLEGPRP